MTRNVPNKTMQSGFSIVGVVLIIVVLALVGLRGWYVWHTNQSKKTADTANSQSATAKTETTADPYAGWKTYTNEQAGLTFRYPSDWKNDAKDEVSSYDNSYEGTNGTLLSPSGRKLTWTYFFPGGSGGICEPDPGDQPFASNNKCSSKEFVSVEKAQTIKNPKNAPRNIFLDVLFITRTKYLSSFQNSKITYQICLDPYDTTGSPDRTPKPGTVMGFVLPCDFFKTGFNAKFEVENEAAFNSADAKTAEKIMKTFNSL